MGRFANPRSGSFRTLLMTMALVLIVPVMIMLISFQTTLRVMILEDYIALNSQVAENIQNTIDTYVNARIDFAFALASNRSLRMLSANIDETIEQRNAACTEIHQFCQTIQAYDHVFSLAAVYLPERDLVISSHISQIRPREFYERYVNIAGVDEGAFFSRVRGVVAREYFPTIYSKTTLGKSQHIMMYVQPLSMGYLDCRAYFISLIDQDAFTDLFLSDLDPHVHFRLLDGSGAELMCTDGFPDSWRRPPQKDAPRWEESVNQTRYHAFYGQGETSGLTYVFYMPEAMVLKQLTVFERYWLLITICCLAVGIGIAISIARRIHRPFRHLLKQAFPEGLTTSTLSLMQEYDLVAEKFQETKNINQQFQQEIAGQYAIMRNGALMNLLTQSWWMSDEELREASDLCTIPTEGQRYRVIFIDCSARPENQSRVLADLSADRADAEDIALEVMALTSTQVVALIAIPQSLPPDLPPNLIEALPGIKAGVSDAHEDIRQLQRALREASIASDHHKSGQSPYVSFDALYTDSGALYYPIEKEMRLIASVRGGNEEEARKLLREIFDENIGARKLPRAMRMALYNSVITTAIKAYDQIGGRDTTLYTRCAQMLTNLDMQHAEDDQLFAEIIGLYIDICEGAKKSNQSKNRRVMENVIAYLEENHADPALCLDKVADHFQVSYYFLSHIFQEEAHRSFSDLLSDIRIRHAVYLLEHSQEAVQDIAARVGYSNISTFLRAFKKRKGMTPLQYRKQ